MKRPDLVLRNKTLEYIAKNKKGHKRYSDKIKITLICRECKKPFYRIPSRSWATKPGDYGKIHKKYCSPTCAHNYLLRFWNSLLERKQRSERAKGKNNGRWAGGITTWYHRLRSTRAFKEWRLKVFQRDNYTCQGEGCGQVGGYLEAHHKKRVIDRPDLVMVVSNGVTLCIKCHEKTLGYRSSKGTPKTNRLQEMGHTSVKIKEV